MRLRRTTALMALLAAGCGGSSQPERTGHSATTPTQPSPAPTETQAAPRKPKSKALPGLPRFTAGYEDWPRINRRPLPPRESGDAHLGTKQVYASKERRPSGRFPDGTIIVKAAERPGKDFVGLIAIMRKERGVDPSHNDWRFVEYTREGAGARFTLTASDSVCWSCHVGAEKTDYLWIYTLGLAR